MEVFIKKIITLHGIPSASGIEVTGTFIFIIGDDSNYLFVLNHDFEVIDKVKLYEAIEFKEEGRIRKKYKADLEAMTLVEYNNQEVLLVIGSGSSDLRERIFVIEPFPPFNFREYSLSSLYKVFRRDDTITSNGKINIEGLAASASMLYFFQRGNITGKNTMISFKINNILPFIMGTNKSLPGYEVNYFELPSINNIPAGFSGATIIPGTSNLLFAASVEDTKDEIADGDLLGSFIGLLDLNNIKLGVQQISRVKNKGTFYTGKLESVTFLSQEGNMLKALAVVDNDQATSFLLDLEIIVD